MWITSNGGDRLLRRFAGLRARCHTPGRRDRDARTELIEFAESCGGLQPHLAEAALAELSGDSRRGVRTSAARGLRQLLGQLDGLARTQLVAEWTCSEDRSLRAAVARALCNQIPVLAASAALEQLSRDADPRIRKSACEAATCRLADDPRAMEIVLGARASDLDVSVRHAAHDGLRRVALLNRAELRCVACKSTDDVVAQDAFGDWGFCRECLEAAKMPIVVEELGGEG